MTVRKSQSQIDVDLRMAMSAECDQVFVGVVAGLTAELLMVNLEVFRGSASLTAPAIALKNLRV